jgi:hypothetical protein
MVLVDAIMIGPKDLRLDMGLVSVGIRGLDSV